MKKYELVRGALSYEMANFIFNYFLLQRDATAHLIKQGIIQDTGVWGTWKDPQVPNTFARYGDPVLETLLMKMWPLMRKMTKRNLIPCYAFGRIYKRGDELVRHIDRTSCEVSCSLHLGGTPWKIFIEPSGKRGVKKIIRPTKVILKKNPPKGIAVDMKPGDMLIYSGCDLEHWREPFNGNIHAQAFLHYNDLDGPHGQNNLFDGRPLLGVPKIKPITLG